MDYLEIAEQAIAEEKEEKAKKATSTGQTPAENVRIKLRNKSDPALEPAYEGLTLTRRTTTLERLPEPLERLVAAATSDVLPKEPVALPDGLTYNLNAYVMAWGCAYVLGGTDEALNRLWGAHRAWKGVN